MSMGFGGGLSHWIPTTVLPFHAAFVAVGFSASEDLPEVLKRQSGYVHAEPDTNGRPSVRLVWNQSKAGVFGLVIGDKDMKTPPSEPGMYGEKRTELRPGIYFWYEET